MNTLTSPQLDQLRQLDSCSISNAIEMFDVRLRNSGFSDSSIHCVFQDFPPMVGYAATARIRTSEPPMEGNSYYYRLDWLNHIMSIPPPRIVVLEDMDKQPGLGAFVGAVHANILLALGCVGMLTNGAVRDLPRVEAINFQMFAGNVSVSHAFSHIFDFGKPVEVGHMEIKPGDLLHGDRHGVQTIPLEIAHKIPQVVKEMEDQEKGIIRLCSSRDFTLEKLREEVEVVKAKRKEFKP
jgi:4-hydroxy-4-methyl-2-oxoglutarate aldolase